MRPLQCGAKGQQTRTHKQKRKVIVYGFAGMFRQVCRGRMYAARKPRGREKFPGICANHAIARKRRTEQTPTGPHTCGPYNAARRGNRPKHISKRKVIVYGFAGMFRQVCRGRMYAARKPRGREKFPGICANHAIARKRRTEQTPTGPHRCGPYNAARRGNNPKNTANTKKAKNRLRVCGDVPVGL